MDALSIKTFIISLLLLLLIKILLLFLNKSNKKKLPPSPPSLPILGHLHLLKTPLHQTLIKITNQYGPATFLRFGSRPALVISSRALADQCFTTHDMAFSNRVQLPSVMLPNTIGMANNGPYWRSVRQIATVELLSTQKLQASSNIRAGEVKDMVAKLFQSHKSNEKSNGFNKLDVKTELFELTMNIMMMLIGGKKFYGEKIEDLEEMKKYREAVEGWFRLTGAANAEDFIPVLKVLDLQGVMKKMRKVTDVNEEMVQKLIDEHRRIGVGKRKTMIDNLLELQKDDAEKFSDFVIQNISIALFLGGTETSANTVEWAMALLLNHPDILNKATAEIDTRVGNNRLIQESDTTNLPYLNCILSETLRLFPAGPLLVPHESREEISLGGYEIPKETMLLVNIYQIQRDAENWEEPTKFKPERFENGNAEGKWMIPFGMGRRKCPGEALAMREMGIMLGTLIQCFDWEKIGDGPVDLTEGAGLTIPKATPLEALYRPRHAMMKVLSEL
ncbi:hypothetical protein LUZ60_015095 [Juncus effusus]|nr:hypothetical protein LUZ60_015095 [Juncus effusus]